MPTITPKSFGICKCTVTILLQRFQFNPSAGRISKAKYQNHLNTLRIYFGTLITSIPLTRKMNKKNLKGLNPQFLPELILEIKVGIANKK